ncbi:MAG: hypothetical protein EBZ69_10175 [Alphaproteobacteria bacterium]|nr:hypothetical protein [Alphaproteobacteria bacterium]
MFTTSARLVERPIFAGGHMDKQPLFLCASTGTSLVGEEKVRYRSKLVNGEIIKSRYTLQQPDMHATYRKHCGAVDQFNKMSLQPGTLHDVWKTVSCNRRLFAATLSWIETNAQLAFRHHSEKGKVTKQQWYGMLSDACIHNPFAPAQPPPNLFVEGHDGPFKGTQGKCWVCRHRTNWKCQCGRPICGLATRAAVRGGPQPSPRTCFKKHMQAVFDGKKGHTGRAAITKGRRPAAHILED